MKKIILFSIVMALGLLLPVQASVLKGKAIDEISTSNPKDTISIKVSKTFTLSDDITLKKNYILISLINILKIYQYISQTHDKTHNLNYRVLFQSFKLYKLADYKRRNYA